jgi:hypothetical protein
MTLSPLLSSNVALNDLWGDIPSRRSKIASCPERWKTTQDSILLAEMTRREFFALFHHLCRRAGRPHAHEGIEVIELNC